MTDLALYFAWHFGLSDWRTGQALGMSENQVRQRRRTLGLTKTGGGAPLRFPSGWEVPPTGTMEKAAAGANRDGLSADKRCSMTIAETRPGRKRESYACVLDMAQDAGRAGA